MVGRQQEKLMISLIYKIEVIDQVMHGILGQVKLRILEAVYSAYKNEIIQYKLPMIGRYKD